MIYIKKKFNILKKIRQKRKIFLNYKKQFLHTYQKCSCINMKCNRDSSTFFHCSFFPRSSASFEKDSFFYLFLFLKKTNIFDHPLCSKTFQKTKFLDFNKCFQCQNFETFFSFSYLIIYLFFL